MRARPDSIDAPSRSDIRRARGAPTTTDVRTSSDIPVAAEASDVDVPVSEAATVMLVRDGADGRGPEVFMLRRTHSAVFGGGYYVFPGGRLDPADRGAAVYSLSEGLDDPSASAMLGVDGGGLGYWMAAIRECFEEAGVLIALDAAGKTVRFDDPVVAARFSNYREQVHSGERSLAAICDAEALRTDSSELYIL